MSEVLIEIRGISPLIMHCSRSVDYADSFTQRLNRITSRGKKEKNAAHFVELADVEWWMGLYTSPRVTLDKDDRVVVQPGTKLVLPAHVCDSLLRDGARKSKNGKVAAAGIICPEDCEVSYDGPSDLFALSTDPNFRFTAQVKVNQKRVVRTRPIFPQWSVLLHYEIDDTVADQSHLAEWLEAAGRLVGVGDWRPGAPKGGSFGRFEVVS